MYMNWQDPASRARSQDVRRRRHYRDFERPGGLVQLGRLFGAAIILLVLAAGGLAYYGATVTPQPRTVEKVLPDDRFPR